MGGGVTLSGIIGKKKVIELPEVGNMSSTNSANPLSCYAGLAVIDEIKSKNLISKTKLKGRILIDFLNKLKENFPEYILSIQGRGLIAAIIFKNLKSENIADKLKKLVFNCMKDGLLVVYTGRESIKIGPPLTITNSALKEGLDVLENNISKIFSKK
jgi:4-aminobutyrate aminotransferase-like enzyme